jgi:hypothetical protein
MALRESVYINVSRRAMNGAGCNERSDRESV